MGGGVGMWVCGVVAGGWGRAAGGGLRVVGGGSGGGNAGAGGADGWGGSVQPDSRSRLVFRVMAEQGVAKCARLR